MRPRRSLPLIGIALIATASAGTALAQRPPAPGAIATSRVVNTDWLGIHLHDRDLVVVEVIHAPGPRAPHMPGSRAVQYNSLTVTRDGLSRELPTPDSLRSLFEGLGISSTSHVVVYAEEAPMAMRMLVSLDAIGHPRSSYLDGGLFKWMGERRPMTAEEPTISRGTIRVTPRADVIATRDWIVPHLGTRGVALIDTRTTGEYDGTGNRSGMPSAGHLPGARQLEWESLFTEGNATLLRPISELRQLYAARVPAGDTVVTYCWVGHRASATYLVARLLGYPARLYDGSYQDWQQRKLPVKTGSAP